MKKYIVEKFMAEIPFGSMSAIVKYSNDIDEFADEIEKIVNDSENGEEILCIYEDKEIAINDLDYLEGHIENLKKNSSGKGYYSVTFCTVQEVEINDNDEDDWICFTEVAKCEWDWSLKEIFDELKK